MKEIAFGVKLPVHVLFLIIFFSFRAYPQIDTISVLNEQTRDYDQKNVKLTLSFDFKNGAVRGAADFTFSPLKENFNRLVLDAKTMQVSSVLLNNKQLDFTQNSENLFINLDKKYGRENTLTVTIEYTAYPTKGFYFFKPSKENPGIPYQIWSQGQSNFNRYWYPAYDLPDDKLTSEVIATVPDTLIAISNGKLISVKENSAENTKTFDWKINKPHSNYLTTLIVGNFNTIKEEFRGINLEYNLPQKWVDKIEYFYGNTPDMIDFYSDYIVPYPYGRYAQTAVQDFEWGGMENVTSTTLNKRIYHDASAEPNYSSDGLIAHEMAHQWFGDYLTCKTWDQIWLNEGFATYLTDLWTEHHFGDDEFKYLRYTENEVYFNDELKAQPLDKIKVDPKGIVPGELGGSKAYERGAAVLNMLRFELGDSSFENGLRYYVNKFKDSVVVTNDFKKAMEQSCGKDLSAFFYQWVYGAGFPVFDVKYDWDKKSSILTVNVKQVQKRLPAVGNFKTPILLEVEAGKLKETRRLTIDKEEKSFSFRLPEKPSMVRFNKNYWILCKVNIHKSFDEWSYQLKYDDDITGRIFAAQHLARFGEKSVPVLSGVLIGDNYYGVKIAAVESLKKIGGQQTFSAISKAANDHDGRVREAAVKALAIFAPSKVRKILLNKFNNENNSYVRAAAAYSIGKAKVKNAFNILEQALNIDSHRNIIRREAFAGLQALGNSGVLPLVEKYTNYKYSHGGMHLLDIAALNCAGSFIKTNREEVIEVTAHALSNPYFRTRNYAAKLLAEYGAVYKLPELKKTLENERRLTVTSVLKSAIKKLEKMKK